MLGVIMVALLTTGVLEHAKSGFQRYFSAAATSISSGAGYNAASSGGRGDINSSWVSMSNNFTYLSNSKVAEANTGVNATGMNVTENSSNLTAEQHAEGEAEANATIKEYGVNLP